MISTNAQPGCCILKKISDQKKFSTNCTANKIIAVCFTTTSFLVFHTKNKATPIKMYSNVQTGPNIQLGGLNHGLLAVANHPSTPDEVKNPEILPTKTGINIEKNNFIKYKTTNQIISS